MLVKRGAEAELRRTEFLGRAAIEKHRAPKAYRLEALDDALRGSRIRHEARLMSEARAAGVPVPRSHGESARSSVASIGPGSSTAI